MNKTHWPKSLEQNVEETNRSDFVQPSISNDPWGEFIGAVNMHFNWLLNRTEQLRGGCLLTKRIVFQDPFDAAVMVSEGPKYPVGKKNSWKLIWQGKTNFIQLSIR